MILDYEWNRKNVEFEIDLEKIDYLGDEELMDQIWLYLIGNAIKCSHNLNEELQVKKSRK